MYLQPERSDKMTVSLNKIKYNSELVNQQFYNSEKIKFGVGHE